VIEDMGKPNGYVIKAWDDETQRLFDQIVQHGRAFTYNAKIAQKFGRDYPDIINEKFLSIGWVRKNNGRIFATGLNVKLIPLEMPLSRNINKRYKFFKIF